MYSIYDQNLIFVIYEGGFCGSFLAALFRSIIDEHRTIAISESGHAHDNNMSYDQVGLADFSIHLKACQVESIGYFDSLQFSDKSTYIIRSHALDVEKNLKIFPNCRQIVIDREIEELAIGRVLNFRKYVIEKCTRNPRAYQMVCEKINLLMSRGYPEVDVDTRYKLMSYIIRNCRDPYLIPLFSHLSYVYEDPYPLPITFSHSSIKYLPFSKIISGDTNTVSEAFEFALGYKLSVDSKIKIEEGLKRYIQAQDSELLFNSENALGQIVKDSDSIIKKLIQDRPWETGNQVGVMPGKIFDFLIFSSQSTHNLLTNLCADAGSDIDYFNNTLKIMLDTETPHLHSYYEVTRRVPAMHGVSIVDTCDSEQFLFMVRNFNWGGVIILDDCGMYDLVPLQFFNSIVLKYHTSVNDLVSSFVELYPDLSDGKEWIIQNYQTREVNEIIYALWANSKGYDCVPSHNQVVTLYSTASRISTPKLRSNQIDEISLIIEMMLGKKLSDKNRAVLAESVRLYNQLMFDSKPMVRREIAFRRVLDSAKIHIEWLRSTKPWLK